MVLPLVLANVSNLADVSDEAGTSDK